MKQLAVADIARLDDVDGGWTFLETIVVIAIILVLTATVGVSSSKILDRARVAATRNEEQLYMLALESYYVDCGTFPTTQQGLKALWEKPVFEPVPSLWNGPYLSHPVGNDPWGNPYEYRIPGPSGLPFGIRSLGSDHAVGGTGSAADIVSWNTRGNAE